MPQATSKARKPRAKAASNGSPAATERTPKTRSAPAAPADAKARQFNEQLRSRGITLIVVPAPVKPTVEPQRFSGRFAGVAAR